MSATLLSEDVVGAAESVLEWGGQGGAGGAEDKMSLSLMRLIDLVLTLVFRGVKVGRTRASSLHPAVSSVSEN